MAQVKILVKGYTSADKPGKPAQISASQKLQSGKQEKTSPTICLVRDGNLFIVTDPGTLSSQGVLIKALKKQCLTPQQINVVFLTHSHIDHFRNIGMFSSAKVIEYYGVWNNDVWQELPVCLTENIKIIKTPGHNYTGLTLLVKTQIGTVAICGDVFWKENYPKTDQYADNPKKLKQSRKKLLSIADYIVPGHSGVFKV